MQNKQDISKRLAQLIKQLRTEKHFTQEDLSDKTGLDYKHIQRLESFKVKNDPKFSTLVKLAGAFDIKVSKIVDYLLE